MAPNVTRCARLGKGRFAGGFVAGFVAEYVAGFVAGFSTDDATPGESPLFYTFIVDKIVSKDYE
jgi:hypothetical protein